MTREQSRIHISFTFVYNAFLRQKKAIYCTINSYTANFVNAHTRVQYLLAITSTCRRRGHLHANVHAMNSLDT